MTQTDDILGVSETSGHTPLPWIDTSAKSGGRFGHVSSAMAASNGGGGDVATTWLANAHANAALIVEAVNSHATLLAERDRLADELHDARGVCDLAIKHRDEAEAENAALKAALEEVKGYAVNVRGEPTARLDRIYRRVCRALSSGNSNSARDDT